jgi:hypothetical protein
VLASGDTLEILGQAAVLGRDAGEIGKGTRAAM